MILIFSREYSLDVEVAASGFTKEMQETFNEVLENENEDSDSDDVETGEENDEANIPELDNSGGQEYSGQGHQSSSKQDVDVTSDAYHVEDKDVEEMRNQFASAMEDLHLDDAPQEKSNESVSGFSCISRSTAATIAPEVIKDRLKKAFQKTDKLSAKKRIRAKGEASATTRQRRDNADTIKTSTGIWGWE